MLQSFGDKRKGEIKCKMKSKRCARCGKKIKFEDRLNSDGYKCSHCNYEQQQPKLNRFGKKNDKESNQD